MMKIFDDAKDKNVANIVVYAKSADNKIYLESAFTTQVKQAELEDAFNKGRLIVMVGTVATAPLYVNANKVGVISASAGTVAEYTAVATPVG